MTCSVVLLGLLAKQQKGTAWFAPGKRTTMLAHNAFPNESKWTDRLDRALRAGTPLVIEIDLVWRKSPKTGEFRSFVAVTKNPTGDEPNIGQYFFPKVRPLVEKALASGDRKNWPLVVLFLDIKDSQPEHIEEIWKQTGEFEGWLTTAVKTSDAAKQSSLDPKPLMVLVNDKPGAAQTKSL